VQDLVMRQTLRLMQPIMPYITEELWQNLGFANSESALLQDSLLPGSDNLRQSIEARIGSLDAQARVRIEQVKELITRIRALKSEYNVASRRDIPFFMLAEGEALALVREHHHTILNLAQVESLEMVDVRPEGMPAGVTELGTAYLDLAHSIDVGAERQRLGKELAKLEKGIQAGTAKLNNEKFLSSAPEAVVNGAREQLAATRARHDEIEKLLQSLPNS